MRKEYSSRRGSTLLNAALFIGLVAVFLAIAVPLVRGALIRKHAAICAGKIIRAADAFDLYAAAMGYYPPDQRKPEDPYPEMNGFFAFLDIDWWHKETYLGGRWEWDNHDDHFTYSIAIYRPHASRRHMEYLDAMIDDGNLMTGLFQRWGAKYHYILKE
jgi:hypothetical protein